jgi:hypothetical protein
MAHCLIQLGFREPVSFISSNRFGYPPLVIDWAAQPRSVDEVYGQEDELQAISGEQVPV